MIILFKNYHLHLSSYWLCVLDTYLLFKKKPHIFHTLAKKPKLKNKQEQSFTNNALLFFSEKQKLKKLKITIFG